MFGAIAGFVLNLTKNEAVAAIAGNAIKAAVTGAIVGAGKALVSDEDPLKGALTGAAVGGAAGGVLSAAGSMTPYGSDASTQLANLGVESGSPQSLTEGQSFTGEGTSLSPQAAYGNPGGEGLLKSNPMPATKPPDYMAGVTDMPKEEGSLLGGLLNNKTALSALGGGAKEYLRGKDQEAEREARMQEIEKAYEMRGENLQQEYDLRAKDRQRKKEENVVPDLVGGKSAKTNANSWWANRINPDVANNFLA